MNNEQVAVAFAATLISALIFALAINSLFDFRDKIRQDIMKPAIENKI